MSKRTSIWATRALLGTTALLLALPILKMRFVHALWIRNESELSIQVVCGSFVNVTLHSKESRHFGYSILGRSFSCVFKSSAGESTCSRTLRGLEDANIAVDSAGHVDCDDY